MVGHSSLLSEMCLFNQSKLSLDGIDARAKVDALLVLAQGLLAGLVLRQLAAHGTRRLAAQIQRLVLALSIVLLQVAQLALADHSQHTGNVLSQSTPRPNALANNNRTGKGRDGGKKAMVPLPIIAQGEERTKGITTWVPSSWHLATKTRRRLA